MAHYQWFLTRVRYSGNSILRIEMDSSEIRGTRSAFGSGLLMRYTLAPIEPVGSGTMAISLEGWIRGPNEPAVGPGIRIPSQVVTQNIGDLCVPITDEQVEAIERLRGGGDAMFHLLVSAVAAVPAREPRLGMQLPSSPPSGSTHEAGQMLEIQPLQMMGGSPQVLRIEREQWLRILEGMGAGRRRMVELPEPALPTEDARWHECMRYLEAALQHHRRGEFEVAIADCRKVVDGIGVVLGAIWRIPRASGKSFEDWTKELQGRLDGAWASDKEAPKLLATLLSAAWTWTSPSAHYGVDMPVREESTLALSLSTDLLMFAGQLIVAHPPIP